jgi:hypothetical protein
MTRMRSRHFRRLDASSWASICIFVLQVSVAATLAAVTRDFATSFPSILIPLGVMQGLWALGWRQLSPLELNEFDGATWLVALGLLAGS